MSQNCALDKQLAGSQIQSLISNLRDAIGNLDDLRTERRYHQAMALLYEVADTLDVAVEDQQGSAPLTLLDSSVSWPST